MRNGFKAALVTVALLSSGCWREICIDRADYPGGRDMCAEGIGSVFGSDDTGDKSGQFSGLQCDAYRYATSCDLEGFPYECNGLWYAEPCD
jgi:hypothetical protein